MLRRTGTRLVLSAGVVAIAATLAGLSTWASFTDSTSATHSVSTGTVDIDLGVAGTAANRLDVPAGNLAPGDVAERALNLLNTSSLAMSQVTLTVTAAPSNALVTDATNGMRVSIDRCSVPWTEANTGGVYTYTCSGTTSSVLASRLVTMTGQALSNTVLAAGGGTSHLRVRTSLPGTAGNTFQGMASDLAFAFTGVQRSATNR